MNQGYVLCIFCKKMKAAQTKTCVTKPTPTTHNLCMGIFKLALFVCKMC